jgi:hypothetical protein
MHALKSTDHKRQSGFALVVALSLMAFVLMLILSMSLLVQVETTNASRSLDQLRAKEAARLALMMAIGDLQKHAGPDQRVTARAEILGDSVQNGERYWTGVWDTENPDNQPVWLVSGLNTDPTAPSTESLNLLGASSVDITSTNYPEQYVSAPIIKVNGRNNETVQEIAWWISDEGVKASVGTLPLNSRTKPNFLDDAETAATELQIANTQGLEELFTNYDRFDPADAMTQSRISSSRDLLFQNSFLDEDGKLDLSGDEAPVHSLNTGSYGVLANTLPSAEAEAGLMQDLSLYPGLLGPGLEEYLQLGETNETQLSGVGVSGLRLFSPIKGTGSLGSLNDGDIALPILPILSNFMVGFTIRQNAKNDPNLYLRMVFFCELWNPYTHTILTTKSTNALEIQLEITGLPKVDVEKNVYFIENNGDLELVNSMDAVVDLQDVLGDQSVQDNPLIIRLKNTANEEWIPGRTKNWTGITNTNQTTGSSPYSSTETVSKWWNLNSRKLGGTTGIDTGQDIAIHSESDTSHEVLVKHSSVDTSELDITVYLYDPVSDSKEQIARYGKATYEPVNTGNGFDYKHKDITFGYHISMREAYISNNDRKFFRGRWLHDDDPRNPSPDFTNEWQKDNDPIADTGSPYIPVIDAISPLGTPEPQAINQQNSAINFITFRRLLDRSSPSFNKLWQDAPLFELPRERVLSLASLQHIYIHNERPFQVGNSWAADGKKNELEWFDRYYFSGISRGDVAADYDQKRGLPNPGLITYKLENTGTSISDWQTENADNEGASRKPAENLMVANRFNLNSTSVAAWKSILGSLRLDSWSYLDYPEDDTSDLSSLTTRTESREGTFARFSNSLQETYEAPASPPTWYYNGNTENVAPSAFYRHGARRFDSTDIECLAKEIVRQLKLKRTPFVSMKDFLSVEEGKQTSLLENVIKIVLAPTAASRIESPNTSPYIKTSNSGRQQWFHKWETLGERDPNEVAIEIDHFSPGFLTQADIMTAIGPMLSPRSDTFKIRARGESLGTQGETVGVATIEATIQRMPEPVDPANDPAVATNRQFKLLSINWLAENEI